MLPMLHVQRASAPTECGFKSDACDCSIWSRRRADNRASKACGVCRTAASERPECRTSPAEANAVRTHEFSSTVTSTQGPLSLNAPRSLADRIPGRHLPFNRRRSDSALHSRSYATTSTAEFGLCARQDASAAAHLCFNLIDGVKARIHGLPSVRGLHPQIRHCERRSFNRTLWHNSASGATGTASGSSQHHGTCWCWTPKRGSGRSNLSLALGKGRASGSGRGACKNAGMMP